MYKHDQIETINLILSQLHKLDETECLNVLYDGPSTIKYTKVDIPNLLYKKKRLEEELHSPNTIQVI
ncbi:MAG: hypothetical protein E6X86_04580 [Clostridium butyricum]|nr:hypothetical protein [Clostridium butyricum]MDU4853568.1 hypothetical protein [Clostridioides difficile]